MVLKKRQKYFGDMQPNPELPEAGGVKLAENEKELLLLELFPLVAKNFLTNTKKKAYEAAEAEKAAKAAAKAEKEAKNAEEAKAAFAAQKVKPITGKTVEAPLPGRIVDICIKVGDKVIYSKYAGTEVKIDGQELIIVRQNDILATVE